MTNIYCRAKRIDNGDWVHGYYVKVATDKNETQHLLFTGYAEDDCGDIYPDWFEVDPKTVCHYTGLNDMNGAFIFENDLIEFGTRTLKIWWNGEAFQWQAKQRECPFNTYANVCDRDYDNIDLGWIAAEEAIMGEISARVIGNVFDNPKLWVWPDAKSADAHTDWNF